MIVECLVITGLIFVVAMAYMRSKKRHFALATLPLLILPLANVISYFAADNLAIHLPMDMFTVYAAINIISALVSSCFVGIMSGKFSRKSTKAAYVFMSLVFNIALAAILTYNMFEAVYR